MVNTATSRLLPAPRTRKPAQTLSSMSSVALPPAASSVISARPVMALRSLRPRWIKNMESSVPVWPRPSTVTPSSSAGISNTPTNIAMSSLPGFTLPDDVSASQRYWDEDIIEPEVEVTPKGTIVVPTIPGLGYSVRRKRIEHLTVRQQVFHAKNGEVSVEGAA